MAWVTRESQPYAGSPYREVLMFPTPEPLGLMLCERVIIEQGTKNPTLVASFTARSVEAFPSEPASFSAFASLTNSSGSGIIELTAVRLETDEQIYIQRGPVSFPHRLAVVNVHFRVTRIRFPSPGIYAFMLAIDGEIIAQRRIEVHHREGAP
jgi:hypothetical protein